MAAVHRAADDPTDLLAELVETTRRSQPDVADVVVEIEIGIETKNGEIDAEKKKKNSKREKNRV